MRKVGEIEIQVILNDIALRVFVICSFNCFEKFLRLAIRKVLDFQRALPARSAKYGHILF